MGVCGGSVAIARTLDVMSDPVTGHLRKPVQICGFELMPGWDAKRPHQVLSAYRFNATPFDFWGRSAYGVCPGPKAAGTGLVGVLQLPDHRDRDHFAGAHREGRSLGEVSMAERGNSPVASIFDGTVEIICEALGLPARQKLKEKTDLKKLGKLSDTDFPPDFKAEIVLSLFERIEGNWEQVKDNWEKSERKRRARDPLWESKNWQLRHQTDFSKNSNSKRLETMLERAIAILAVADELPEWHNQISVDSGLVDGGGGRHVDLVRMDGNDAELVELKWPRDLKSPNDTPLSALFQVLEYGLALLLSRRKAEKFGYCGLELIEAPVVKLAVLAPSQYYDGYDCRKYADVVNKGLRLLRDTHSDLPEMSFHFLQFPSCFEHPFQTDDEVCELRMLGERAKSLSTDDDEVHEFRMSVKNSSNLMRLRDTMSALEPVIWDS